MDCPGHTNIPVISVWHFTKALQPLRKHVSTSTKNGWKTKFQTSFRQRSAYRILQMQILRLIDLHFALKILKCWCAQVISHSDNAFHKPTFMQRAIRSLAHYKPKISNGCCTYFSGLCESFLWTHLTIFIINHSRYKVIPMQSNMSYCKHYTSGAFPMTARWLNVLLRDYEMLTHIHCHAKSTDYFSYFCITY